MATKSRMKRRAFRNPKRARGGGSNWFNVSLAVVLVVGTSLVLVSRHPNAGSGSIGPKLNSGGSTADHWHAALGINVCGTWQVATPWPNLAGGTRGRFGNTGVYAGLHTHELADGAGDGIIHMEPGQNQEAGRNATVGLYMKYGGWKLNATSMKLWAGANGKIIAEKNGQKCGGKPAKLRWAIGSNKTGSVKMVEQHGNPAGYKLYEEDVVGIYFVAANQDLTKLPAVPAIKNLTGAKARGEGGAAATTTTSGPGTPTTAGGTTTSGAGTTTTSQPTTTTKK